MLTDLWDRLLKDKWKLNTTQRVICSFVCVLVFLKEPVPTQASYIMQGEKMWFWSAV